ncbi:hypothetical protein AciX9_1274 [Granulicella tundricola MP5ACTX9]|uniref:Cytoplasmic protein n=2 Tax=Granulicella TaxID=940557 RepID=E8X572_GRATM|nr:hypothetical protein AciX9_1274 [Granulicella tundricola MP5ACTX9]
MANPAPHVYKTLPSFSQMLSNYPHEGGPEVPKTLIGGDVNAAWITDTCAIRMSRALNYSGFPIPAQGHSKMYVVKGGDGMWYAIRVAELKAWLQAKLGPPSVAPVRGQKISMDAYKGRKGILALKIHYAPRPGENTAAAGHIDLWDGTQFAGEYSQQGQEQDDFDVAEDAVLWFATD